MSGGIIFCQGRPLALIAVHQERTSLSSCEAEIWATNEFSKLLMSICRLAQNVWDNCHSIADTDNASPLDNDNDSCVKWSHNMTTKQIQHLEMHENAVHEWVQDVFLKVLHVSGQINPVNIFTKEIQDGAHFQRLQDSFMCPLSEFLQQSLLDVHLLCHHVEPRHLQILPSSDSLLATFTYGSYLSALCFPHYLGH
jgi:hypothetical protein